jgi:hypothetical protein
MKNWDGPSDICLGAVAARENLASYIAPSARAVMETLAY